MAAHVLPSTVRRVVVLALVLAMTLVATATSSTAADTAGLTGTIQHEFPDYNSGRAPDGMVRLYDPATGKEVLTAQADADGTFLVSDIPPGDYLVLLWNGTDDLFFDFFGEFHRDKPLFDPNPNVVRLRAGETKDIVQTLRPLFVDMFESEFTDAIYWMGNKGITRGCNPEDGNFLYCPNGTVSRAQMAAFLVRALGLTEIDDDVRFTDTVGSPFERDIRRLATAGITRGCNPPANDEFCPDDPVTREQMASFLTRAFRLPKADNPRNFSDSRDSIHVETIERLAAAGVTRGCNPPDNTRFCPEAPVTRGQMAAFLLRAFEWKGTAYDTRFDKSSFAFAERGVAPTPDRSRLLDR